MRKINVLVTAFVLAAFVGYSASAATLQFPSTSPGLSYTTVAAMEMTVAGESANLREKPTTKSKLLQKLPKGTKVIVTETVADGKWAHVQVNGKDGYILLKLLK